MGKDTTQPTPIDANEYERFKQFVQNTHGQVRGNLKREIENALRDYRTAGNGEDQLTRIENDVATLKALMAEGEADGGVAVDTLSESDSTRPRSSTKPAPNQPRQDKVEYLLSEVISLHSGNDWESGQVAPKEVREIVESNYSFESDTVNEYVDLILSELDAQEHPRHGKTYLWGVNYEQAVDEIRESADDTIEQVSE
jgi:hypothetical protein